MDFQVLLLTIGVSFILAVIAAPLLIPLLRRMKFGQQVREDGPQSHLKKAEHQRWAELLFYLRSRWRFLNSQRSKTQTFMCCLSLRLDLVSLVFWMTISKLYSSVRLD